MNFCFVFISISVYYLGLIMAIIKRNWKEFKKKIEKNLTSLCENFSGFYHVSGDAGDSLAYHSHMMFSTWDRDNDRADISCARGRNGAWWYQKCYESNLNGLYHRGNHTNYDGVNWNHWRGYYYSLQKTEMKIRPSKS